MHYLCRSLRLSPAAIEPRIDLQVVVEVYAQNFKGKSIQNFTPVLTAATQ
jgi:hypothetical protein